MNPLKRVVMLASLVLAVVAAGAVRAEEEAPKTAAYAVVVGIDHYADSQIKPRQHAEADAAALHDVLTSKDYLGAPAGQVHLLLGKEDKERKSLPATHANVLKALQDVIAKAGKDDLVIFAFFGEGAPLGERTCYLCSDSTFKGRAKNSLAAAEIEHELTKLKSQRFCAFLDVNFKGFDAGKEKAPDANLARFYQEFFGSHKDEDEEPQQTGRVVFLATDGMTQSLDLEKHGLFAKVLLDGLKGAADKEGYEPDGNVTIDELTEYLEKTLPQLARNDGKTDEEKKQAPVILGGRLNHFVLTHNPAAMPRVRERLAKLAQLAKDQKLSPELAEEGQRLLERMPKLEGQRKLRQEYQKLADGASTPDQFREKRDALVEGMKVDRAYANRFAKKVMDAVHNIRQNYVKEVNEGELVGWAIRGLYRRLDEKLPADLSERLGKVKELKKSQLQDLLADAREKLGKREDLDGHKDIDIALQRMLNNLDPYSTYIDRETLKRFEQDTQGQFTGIGIQIRKDFNTDMIVVVTPIKGSPAYKKGVLTGDIITKIIREVDSEGNPLDEPEVIPTKGLPINDAVKKILGKEGTKVKIVLQREGVAEPIEMEITRGRVEVESVLGVRRNDKDEWDWYLDPNEKLVYIRLTQFSRNTFRDLERVMKRLAGQGVKGMVLDLRFNPGGLLDSAVNISDLFIDDGLIVSIRPRVGEEEKYTGNHDGSYLDFPMVCLVNGGSASGSEIVAACLQDQKRALIIGERSYGKGSVQNIRAFDGGELKLTIASYWRPSGKNIHKAATPGQDSDEWGVSPDKGFEMKLSPKELADLELHLHEAELIRRKDRPAKVANPDFKDRQLDLAVQYLRDQMKLAKKLPAKKEKAE